jgi:hypothetical protein
MAAKAKKGKKAPKARKSKKQDPGPAKTSKDKTQDSDWEVYEEEVKPEKEEGKPRISNNMLWILFAVIVIGFALSPFIFGGESEQDLQTDTLNGITIKANGNPINAVKQLKNAHIQGKTLDESNDAHNALNEILVVLGQTSSTSTGSYTLFAGITDETGITVTSNTVRIEGKNREDFWTAIWTFTSILTNTEIESEIDLFDVQTMPVGRSEIYLLQDQDSTCPNYARIISAEGDIIPPLFRNAELGFNAFHYYLSGGQCSPADNQSRIVSCPVASDDTLILKMSRSSNNKITISGNEILFEYSDCGTVDRISTILGDMLYPNRISALADMQVPVEF